jgi:hypothetical protein
MAAARMSAYRITMGKLDSTFTFPIGPPEQHVYATTQSLLH